MEKNIYASGAQKAADHALEEKLGDTALHEAKQATEDEHAQTLFQAFSQNRRAVLWSVMISLSIVMEGYDTILMGNFFAYPEFQKKFGNWYGDEIGWQVSGPWQTGLNMGSTVGGIFGGLLNGYFASKYGYRWVLIISMAFLNAFIFLTFFAPGPEVLLVGQIMCGLSWGVFATLSPAYASEVCPTNLRGYMTTYVNLCWAIGQLIAAGVLRGCLNIEGEMGYRIPFAIQWLWPTPLMLVAYLAPESPWFLVRHDRLDEARKSIFRLSGPEKTEEQVSAQLAMMLHTTKIESEVTKGASYLDCFRGIDLRRTEVVMVAFMGQILSGSSFAYTPTYFFTTAGMDTAKAFELSLGAKGMAFIGTVLNPTEWNLRGRTGFFWGSTAFCVFIWSYFRLPEVKGRTYEELDLLFTNKVPARHFASTHVDAYTTSSSAEDEKIRVEQVA
ncbi:putative mfs sugar transporter [Diaporthe ampelina]|uniref:Putative mfs sugar transporter n=1 Tax=Diaporthe ampelina TaxID=1214573 RepID=A0A0G2HHE8_9PEZI|nr:putative mfs sugar transporter [Diaporthe ampelina]